MGSISMVLTEVEANSISTACVVVASIMKVWGVVVLADWTGKGAANNKTDKK